MSPKTVADQLVQQLVDAGVSRIYGIVGDSLNPIVDAVRRTGGSEKAESIGYTSGMRKQPPLRPQRMPRSPENSQCVPDPAVPETFT